METRELSLSQTNAGENQNNSDLNTELVHREKVPGTPFEIVGNNDHGYFLALGKYRLSNHLDLEHTTLQEAAKHELKENGWNIITNLITLIIQLEKELQEDQQKTKS